MLAKPMVFDGIVLGTRCHLARFEFAESEGANVILVNFDMKICILGDRETTCACKLSNKVKEREKIFAGCA
jgi:hypothetical protein